MPDNARYTLQEAADTLRVSTRTLRRRIAEGTLPARKALQGKREVWTVDAADLAIMADSEGHSAASWPAPVTADADNTAAMLAELDRLRRELAAVVIDRDFLREILANVTKALPPAPVEAQHRSPTSVETPQEPMRPAPGPVRPPWWRRVFGGTP